MSALPEDDFASDAYIPPESLGSEDFAPTSEASMRLRPYFAAGSFENERVIPRPASDAGRPTKRRRRNDAVRARDEVVSPVVDLVTTPSRFQQHALSYERSLVRRNEIISLLSDDSSDDDEGGGQTTDDFRAIDTGRGSDTRVVGEGNAAAEEVVYVGMFRSAQAPHSENATIALSLPPTAVDAVEVRGDGGGAYLLNSVGRGDLSHERKKEIFADARRPELLLHRELEHLRARLRTIMNRDDNEEGGGGSQLRASEMRSIRLGGGWLRRGRMPRGIFMNGIILLATWAAWTQ